MAEGFGEQLASESGNATYPPRPRNGVKVAYAALVSRTLGLSGDLRPLHNITALLVRSVYLAQDGHQSLRGARLNQWRLSKLVNGQARTYRNGGNIDRHCGVIADRHATQ
jgi:hypothetical protein